MTDERDLIPPESKILNRFIGNCVRMRFERINKMGAPCFCFIPSVPFQIPHPPPTTISKEKKNKDEIGSTSRNTCVSDRISIWYQFPRPVRNVFPILSGNVTDFSHGCFAHFPKSTADNLQSFLPQRKMNQQIFGRKRSTCDARFFGVKIRRRR